MKEGNTAMAGGAAIVKTAPNLEAAQAMMDLLSSAEFQDARAEVSAGRGSNGNCDLKGLPDSDTLGLVDLDQVFTLDNRLSHGKSPRRPEAQRRDDQQIYRDVCRPERLIKALFQGLL